MKKAKIFSNSDQKLLEQEINNFLRENEEKIYAIENVNFQTTPVDGSKIEYSVLIIYR